MAKRFIVVVGILVSVGLSVLAQSKPSIQGVWRVAERTTTGPNGTTNKNPQPGLWIFAGKHYSIVQDNSPTPRPAPGVGAIEGKPTEAQLIAAYQDWAPVTANSGTYEVSGTTLHLRPLVAKSAGNMQGKGPTTYQFKLDGNALVVTAIAARGANLANPVTVRLMRVE